MTLLTLRAEPRRALARTLCLIAAATAAAACSPPPLPATDAGADAPPLADASPADTPPADAPPADAPVSRALAPNDVSILIPLAPSLWPASAPGRGGALLSREVFARIGRPLFRERTGVDAQYDALRVVAVRYDPCFTHAASAAAPCQPQLRLVMQGVDPATSTAFDGALHLLYNLTPADDAAVRRELAALAELAPMNAGQPLGVSPVLAAQGLDGAYGQRLRALVTMYTGAENLVRVTFMTRTLSRQGVWEFGGLHVREWPATDFPPAGPVQIALLGAATLQTINAPAGPGYAYVSTPQIGQAQGVPALSAEGVANTFTTAQLAGVRALLAWARGVEDPARHTPDTIDCASCHVANRVARHIEAQYPMAASDLPALTPRAVGDAETTNENLRVFGYFDRHPVVAQRTANETASVLARLR